MSQEREAQVGQTGRETTGGHWGGHKAMREGGSEEGDGSASDNADTSCKCARAPMQILHLHPRLWHLARAAQRVGREGVRAGGCAGAGRRVYLAVREGDEFVYVLESEFDFAGVVAGRWDAEFDTHFIVDGDASVQH